MKIKIAILGTRGIPNNYGGFEQFAEYLSVGLCNFEFEVYVYNSHNHPFQEKKWNGVNIIHKFDPEFKIGTAGQFIYDLNCILDCRKRNFDIILQLGYTSSSVWSFLFPKKSIVVTNMDGLEWKRTKYSDSVKKFLKYAEKLAVEKSNFLISDSIGIQKYLDQEYKVSSKYIPYGSHVFELANNKCLSSYNVLQNEYNLLIARLEPENSIEIILDGYVKSETPTKILVVANFKTKYGIFLTEKYKNHKNIIFTGAIYDIEILNNLRYFSLLYFHGHTVGGTNPSLLEAMGSSALIVAHKNEFNSAILNEDGFYFNTADEVSIILNAISKKDTYSNKISNNISKIKEFYSWPKITESYKDFFLQVLKPN